MQGARGQWHRAGGEMAACVTEVRSLHREKTEPWLLGSAALLWASVSSLPGWDCGNTTQSCFGGDVSKLAAHSNVRHTLLSARKISHVFTSAPVTAPAPLFPLSLSGSSPPPTPACELRIGDWHRGKAGGLIPSPRRHALTAGTQPQPRPHGPPPGGRWPLSSSAQGWPGRPGV